MAFAAAAAAGVLLGLGLAAVQLLPTLELGRQSVRAAMAYDEFIRPALPVRHLSHFLFPYAYGGFQPPGCDACLPLHGTNNPTECTAACGVVTLLLAGLGFAGSLRRRLAWFWLAWAVLGVLLALGDATPLGRLLFQVPGYNLFRCPGRHLMVFSLATAVLAGLGLSGLACGRQRGRTLALLAASAATAGLVILVWAHLAGQEEVAAASPTPAAGAVGFWALPRHHPGVGLPLAATAAALAALWAWYLRRAAWTAAVLAAVLVADVGQFAWFGEWRRESPPRERVERPRGPAWFDTLAASGERYVSLFRDNLAPESAPANLASLWGLANAHGYTPLRLARHADVLPQEVPSRLAADLLCIRHVVAPPDLFRRHDVTWHRRPLALRPLSGRPGVAEVSLVVAGVPATHVALVSELGLAPDVPQGSPVAELVVTDAEGRASRAVLRAGEHTAECAWDRPDVRARVRHHKPAVFESLPVPGADYSVHCYLAVLPVGPHQAVRRITVRRTGPGDAALLLRHLTLLDARAGRQFPLHPLGAVEGQWTETAVLADGAVVVENSRPLRRAWLASEVVCLRPDQALDAVRREVLPDGAPFDPYRTALVEEPVAPLHGPPDPDARVEITRYEPTVVELRTRSARDNLLVLGDVHYPGWKAFLDDLPRPVVRADYLLRGVRVPAGEHRVRFVFRSRSLVWGARISVLALLAWLALVGASLLRRRDATSVAGP